MSATVEPALLLTVGDAAQRLKLSESFVYRLAALGQIPVVRVGRAVRIPADALEAWVRAQSTGVPDAS